MGDIFISYAREDQEKAQALADVIETQGWTVWWDRRIPPGKTYEQVIDEALKAAKCIVVLWSDESIKSKWVRAESEVGNQRDILVPILVGNVQEIPLGVRLIQAANLTSWEGDTEDVELRSVLEAIDQILKKQEGEQTGKDVSGLDQSEAEASRLKIKKSKKMWLKNAHLTKYLIGGIIASVVLIAANFLFPGINPFQTKSNQSIYNKSKIHELINKVEKSPKPVSILDQYENLVLSGGLSQMHAIGGALEVLNQKGIVTKLKRFVGVSGGAVVAGLLSCNYSVEEILQILKSTNPGNFLDDDWGTIRDTQRLLQNFGYYKGDRFQKWYATLLEAKAGNESVTFEKAHFQFGKDLIVTATDVNSVEPVYFSKETSPRMRIIDAVRAAITVPFFISAIRSARGDLFVDGSLLDSYPIGILDEEIRSGDSVIIENFWKTIGVQIYSVPTTTAAALKTSIPGSTKTQNASDFMDFTEAILNCLMSGQASGLDKKSDFERTIFVNTFPVKANQFDVSEEDIKIMLDRGREGANRYFSR